MPNNLVASNKNKKHKNKTYELVIKSLSSEGRGIAHIDNKIIFIRGALPTEKIIASRITSRAKYEEAKLEKILIKANNRIPHKCAVFGTCGGCSMQHITSEEQIKLKANWIKDQFIKQTKLTPEKYLKPLQCDSWGYRHKARFSVKYVEKKARVLIGFHQYKSSFITDMQECEILPYSIGKRINELINCIEQLSVKKQVPQIELAIGDANTVLILRHLQPLTENDKNILRKYAQQLNITWLTQSGNLNTIKPLDKTAYLSYKLKKHNIEIEFLATDFVQVNFKINTKMVNQTLQLLELNSNDKVIDLFCGLANFSLAIARYTKKVIAVDNDHRLIERARYNALKNNVNNVEFYEADLHSYVEDCSWFKNKTYNKALLNPARAGALQIIELLPKLKVKKLVYISCNPSTLVRDSMCLTKLGYNLKALGVMDMFPQTSHIETMALFELK